MATSGLNAHLFRPPDPPAFTSASPSFASGAQAGDYFSAHKSRKRQRPDSSHVIGEHVAQLTPGNAHTPSFDERRTAETPAWLQCPTPSDAMYGSVYAGAVMVNDRYRLRDGLDTPGIMASNQEGHSVAGNGDSAFGRRQRYEDDRQSIVPGAQTISGPLARERNGVARMPESRNGSPQNGTRTAGWTGLALGLVGKVFSFGTSVVSGFFAGGGRGYEFAQPLRTSPPARWMTSQRFIGGGTPVPGSWHDDADDFMGDFEQDNPSSATRSPTSTLRPPNKRRQTDKDTWVMIGTPDEDAPSSPKRKSSSNNIPRSAQASRPQASRANSRRSLAPMSRRSSSYVAQNGSPALAPQQPVGFHAIPANRRASLALTRSPRSRPSSAGHNSDGAGGAVAATGLSPDVEKLVKRQAKHEKATDRTMNSMQKQLKDLISQAQAALGTKYAVEGDAGDTGRWDSDEGFVDEDW